MISMGMSLHNGLAVLEGFIGKKTPFIRTPKFNATDHSGIVKNNSYINGSISLISVAEGLLGLYFLAGIVIGIRVNDFGLVLFHLMLALGFFTVSFQSLKSGFHVG